MLNSIQNQRRTGGAQINCSLTNVTVIPGIGYPKLAVKRFCGHFGSKHMGHLGCCFTRTQTPGATADAIYKSTDMGASWIQIGDPALMQFGEISALEGDMRTQDLVYVANGGRGCFTDTARVRPSSGQA
jgi:hypothetical protein